MVVEIRTATDGDLDAVAAIYAHQVLSGTATFALEVPPRSTWEEKVASTHPGDHFLVAVDVDVAVDADGADPVLLGFAYSGPFRDRGAYTHTREVSVYLDVDATGRGLGRRLYDDLLARLVDGGMRTAVACIALPNDASEALHRSCGFERVGAFREVGRKHDRWIDIAWWQTMLATDLPVG